MSEAHFDLLTWREILRGDELPPGKCVYVIFGSDTEDWSNVLYVGTSWDVRKRLRMHIDGAAGYNDGLRAWIHSSWSDKFLVAVTRGDLRLESDLIAELDPAFNTQHNPSRSNKAKYKRRGE